VRKPLEAFAAEGEAVDGGPRLRRTLGVWHLTAISIGATLGTGILVVLGTAVPLAGPAVWISFVLAGVAALLSALSYAEMAGSVPVSGSSYSYAYATLGEGIAWVCGWCLVLEYAVSVAAVAVGAGQYVNEALDVFGLALPAAIAEPPGAGGVLNLPAAVLVLLATLVLVPGARESAWVNTLLVVVKVALLVFFVAVAFTAFSAGNFEPLAPMGAAETPPPGCSSRTSASTRRPRPARRRGTRSGTCRGRSSPRSSSSRCCTSSSPWPRSEPAPGRTSPTARRPS
jgi:APA family basic amino acid/polyamine antiporter